MMDGRLKTEQRNKMVGRMHEGKGDYMNRRKKRRKHGIEITDKRGKVRECWMDKCRSTNDVNGKERGRNQRKNINIEYKKV